MKHRVNWNLTLGNDKDGNPREFVQGDEVSLTADEVTSLAGSGVVTPVSDIDPETKKADADRKAALEAAEKQEAERKQSEAQAQAAAQREAEAADAAMRRDGTDSTISPATGTKVTVEGEQKSTAGDTDTATLPTGKSKRGA